jgi:hypothetical protein
MIRSPGGAETPSLQTRVSPQLVIHEEQWDMGVHYQYPVSTADQTAADKNLGKRFNPTVCSALKRNVEQRALGALFTKFSKVTVDPPDQHFQLH